MVLLNFAHSLTPTHVEQIEAMTAQKVEQLVEIPTQFSHEHSFAEQVRELVDSIGFTAKQWQTVPLLINPPTLNLIAVTLLAELHGRMGYFPTVIRLRPVPGIVPPRFEMAEIIGLQMVRDAARERRADAE